MSFRINSSGYISDKGPSLFIEVGGTGAVVLRLIKGMMASRFNSESQVVLTDRHPIEAWYSKLIQPLRFRSRNTIRNRIDDFCAASLLWVDQFSNADPELHERARSLSKDLISFARDRYFTPEWRFEPFLTYLRNGKPNYIKVPGCQFTGMSNEFDGLVLYLAANLKGSLDWLGEERTEQNALLIASISEALHSTLNSLSKCRSELLSMNDLSEIRKHILREQLNGYGIKIKYEDLSGIKACLISTRFGSVVHVNAELPSEEQEFACLHELGHFMLRHRANSEYALDPSLLTTKMKAQFVRQEREADGFAALWRYVLQTTIEYALLTPRAKISHYNGQIAGLNQRDAIPDPQPSCAYANF